MSFTISLESGFSSYSVDLEFEFSIAQDLTDGKTRNFTTIANQDPQAARHFGFQPGQNNPRLEYLLYNNFDDKSNGSLLSSNVEDNRLAIGKQDLQKNTGEINSVDTTNETVTVNGDITNYLGTGEGFEIVGSTGNDGSFTVSSISYDSNNDETTITVNEDITDSTADGWTQNSVATVKHQKVWLEEYVFDNTSDPRWKLFGGRFSDRNGDGVDEGTNIVIEDNEFDDLAGQVSLPGVIQFKEGVTV